MRPIHVVIIAIVSAALIGAASPIIAAQAAPPQACGIVSNAAGWPIAGATVTAVTEEGGTPVSTDTDADGAYALGLPDVSLYTLHVTPPATLVSPHYEANDSTVVNRARAEAGCTTSPGYQRDIQLEAPDQLFVDLTVVDAVDGAALAQATVELQGNQQTTDSEGHARFACRTDAGQTNLLTVHLEDYLETSVEIACTSDEGPAIAITRGLWRTPIRIHTSVGDAIDRDAETQMAAPVVGATVEVALPQAACEATAPAAETAQLRSGGVSTDATPYICSATTDDQGTTTVVVPWDENGWQLSVTESRFAARVRQLDVPVAASRPGAPETTPGSGSTAETEASATRIQRVHITLNRAEVTITATVTDAFGAALAEATASFVGPAPLAAFTEVSFEEGALSATLLTGDYTLTLTSDGKNGRTCSLTVGVGGIASGLTPSRCFSLIAAGKAAVTGHVIDKRTGTTYPDMQVCASDCAEVALADGAFSMEVDAPDTTALTLPRWTQKNIATADLKVDEWRDVGTFEAERTRTALTVLVTEPNGDPIEDVPIVAKRINADGTMQAVPTGSNLRTGPTGYATTGASNNALDWTHPNDGADELGDAVFEIALATTADVDAEFVFTARQNATGIDVIHLTLNYDDIISVSVIDGHTGTQVATEVFLKTVGIGSNPKCWGYCEAATSAEAMTPIAVLGGFDYEVCTKGDDRYVLTCVTASPGDEVAIETIRDMVLTSVTAVDAHTGAFVTDVTLSLVSEDASAPFGCAEFGSTAFTCSAPASGTTGVANLQLPKSDGGEYCIQVEGGDATVVYKNQGTTRLLAESIAVQTSRACFVGSLPPSEILVARAVVPMAITTSTPDGAPLAGATVTAAPVHAGFSLATVPFGLLNAGVHAFECDAVTNATAESPSCTVTTSEDGTASLPLPAAGGLYIFNALANAPARWQVEASADGHTTESEAAVDQGASLDFVLEPNAFLVTLRFHESGLDGRDHRCTDAFDEAVGVVVTLTELPLAAAAVGNSYTSTLTHTNDGSGDCQAAFNIALHRESLPAASAGNPQDFGLFLVTASYGANRSSEVVALSAAAPDAQVRVVHNPRDTDAEAANTTAPSAVWDATDQANATLAEAAADLFEVIWTATDAANTTRDDALAAIWTATEEANATVEDLPIIDADGALDSQDGDRDWAPDSLEGSLCFLGQQEPGSNAVGTCAESSSDYHPPSPVPPRPRLDAVLGALPLP